MSLKERHERYLDSLTTRQLHLYYITVWGPGFIPTILVVYGTAFIKSFASAFIDEVRKRKAADD